MAKGYASPSVETLGSGLSGQVGSYWYFVDIISYTTSWWHTFYIYHVDFYIMYEHAWLFNVDKNVVWFKPQEP